MAKYEAKFKVKRSPINEDFSFVLLIALGFIVVYIVCLFLYADLSRLNFDTLIKNPVAKGKESYLFFWLLKNRFYWYSMAISALPSVSKKYVYSVTTLLGFILGLITGNLFGPVARPVHPGATHNGWFIWGCVFVVSIILGIILQIIKDKKNRN